MQISELLHTSVSSLSRVYLRTLNRHKAALWRWKQALQRAEVAPRAAEDSADGKPETWF